MKKLAMIFAATAGLVSVSYACPNSEHDNAPQATAKKDEAPTPKVDATKTEAAKPADTAKAAPAKNSKDTQKKPDKVSSK